MRPYYVQAKNALDGVEKSFWLVRGLLWHCGPVDASDVRAAGESGASVRSVIVDCRISKMKPAGSGRVRSQ